jgi:membrane protease YdiL (CAAX protease family)
LIENQHKDRHATARYPDRTSFFFGDDGLRAGWGILLYLSLLIGLFFTAHLITSAFAPASARQTAVPLEHSPHSIIVAETTAFLVVALASWIMSRIEHRPLGSYGLGETRKLSRFLGGLGWGIVLLSLLVFILKLSGLLVFDGRLLDGAQILRYGATWAVGFLLVALFEEYLLRGYLQFTLSRAFAGIFETFGTAHSSACGFWSAALLLSLVFGLNHRANPGESPLGLFAAGLAGLVFCLSLWRTGSLWWAIGFHASWDWAQSFLYGVANSGTMAQFHLLASHPAGKPLLSGGATGPEGSIFILPIMALVAAVILLTLPRAKADS